MSTKLSIFITGATGYVGGSVVARLLKHPKFNTFKITALVRSPEKAEKLRTLGLETVIGSYDDLDVLTQAASQADLVFTIANSDNLPAAEAILKGLKKRHESTGVAPTLIHTSGTANITDDARGMHADHRLFSDLDVEAINALPITQMHRNVDIPLVEADEEGYVKVYFIVPGTIFGTPSGPLVDLGIQNMHSIQLPWFVKASVDRKQGAYFGKGLNVWPGVDVDDTADLYIVLFNDIQTNRDAVAHGREGWYFVENFEFSAYEVAKHISEVLVELGVSKDPEPSAFTDEEALKYFGHIWPLLATNSRARADRSRSIGWKPVKGKEILLEVVKVEVEAQLAKK